VYRCDLCDRWFCERHLKPRLAFIKDFDAIDNIPEVRALYFTESEQLRSENGHPDFEYSRRKFRELDIEEKRRNELIKQALDRMNQYYAEIPEKPFDTEAERKRTMEKLLKEEEEIGKPKSTDSYEFSFLAGYTTTTNENKYHHKFRVPAQAYSIEKYRKQLNDAKTLSEVEHILHDYYRHQKS
jgi:hypothetical protein